MNFLSLLFRYLSRPRILGRSFPSETNSQVRADIVPFLYRYPTVAFVRNIHPPGNSRQDSFLSEFCARSQEGARGNKPAHHAI
jgi:hypothetical protein